MARKIGRFITIGSFIERGIENGTISPEQVCVYYDKNNNIQWIGKADFTPIYLDWVSLDYSEHVNNELRLYEVKAR